MTTESLRHCPACNQSFSEEFAPSHYGVTHRQDASCLNPDCRSLERHRLLWLYLQENILTNDKNMFFLEIGPTRSLKNAFKRYPNVRYIGMDLISKRANVRADINDIPFADNTFDIVVCYQILEHIYDPILAIRELKRVVKRDGKAFFQVPLNIDLATTSSPSSSSPREREILFGQEDHLRVFGMDFEELLREGGFFTQCIDYAGRFSSEERKLMGLKLSYLIGPKNSPYTTSEKFYLATKT